MTLLEPWSRGLTAVTVTMEKVRIARGLQPLLREGARSREGGRIAALPSYFLCPASDLYWQK